MNKARDSGPCGLRQFSEADLAVVLFVGHHLVIDQLVRVNFQPWPSCGADVGGVLRRDPAPGRCQELREHLAGRLFHRFAQRHFDEMVAKAGGRHERLARVHRIEAQASAQPTEAAVGPNNGAQAANLDSELAALFPLWHLPRLWCAALSNHGADAIIGVHAEESASIELPNSRIIAVVSGERGGSVSFHDRSVDRVQGGYGHLAQFVPVLRQSSGNRRHVRVSVIVSHGSSLHPPTAFGGLA